MIWMKWGTASGGFCEGLVFNKLRRKFVTFAMVCQFALVRYGWLRFLYLRKFMGITNCGHGERMHSMVQSPEDLLN